MDIESTYTFATKFKSKYGDVDIQLNSVAEALEVSKNNGVPLFLFLHQEDDIFSTKFCPLLSQDVVDTINILIWDVEQKHMDGLIRLCEIFLKFDILIEFIRNKQSGLFLFKFVDDDIELITLYQGNIEETEFVSTLYQTIFQIKPDNDNTMPYVVESRITDPYMPYVVDDATNDVNMPYILDEATIDVYMPYDVETRNISRMVSSVPLLDQIGNARFNIEETLESAIKNSLEKVKPLLLYVHNEEDPFSKLFSSLLLNNTVNDLFNNFSFYVWDVNDECRSITYNILSELYSGIGAIQSYLDKKKGAVCIFSTLEEELTLVSQFNKCMSEQDFMFRLYNSYRLHEEERFGKYELSQKEAIVSAIQSFEDIFGKEKVTFDYNPIQHIIQSSVLCKPKYWQKILVLFYYNENDYVSNKLSLFLTTNERVKSELENLFIIVPWDVGNVSYHKALKSIVKNYFDLDPMSTLIDKKEGALFFIVANKNQAEVAYHVGGDFHNESLENAILENVTMYEGKKKVTDIEEINACTRFIKNHTWLPPNLMNKIPLHKVILENCICPQIKSRKMLLFYLYRNDKTGRKFMEILKENYSVRQIISNNFIFIGWHTGVFNRTKLSLAIKRNFDLDKMEKMLDNGKSGLFIFTPIAQSLVLFGYIEDTCSKRGLLKELNRCSEYFSSERNIEERLSEKSTSTGPAQFHQMMFDQLGNRDYDCFEFNSNEAMDKENMIELLKKKLYYGMFGPPVDIEDITDNREQKQESRKQETVNELFEQVMDQVRKYYLNIDEVMITCIFNCLVPLPEVKLERMKNDENYSPGSDFIPFPVFVLRKCINCPTRNACRIFIDHDLRVYSTWQDYLEDNKLPKGMFIVPKNGRYQGDHWGNVRLEYKLSPACDTGRAVLNAVDVGTTVLGVAASVVGIAAIIPAIPVAPVVAVGALVTGAGVGLYSLVRSSMSLHDRFSHDETMSVANSEARSAYLNLLGGMFSLTGSGATFAFSYFVRNGVTFGVVARSAINGINGINVVVNGSAVANSAFEVLYQWIQNDEAPSKLTLIQLTSSVLFFGHAVYNFQTANTIINESQYQSMQEIEASLRSNRHRKTFNKLTKETIRVTNDVQQANAEVISYMKQLDNRDEILASLTRANKALNKNKIKFSVKDQQLNFNGVVVDIADFSNMSNLQKSEYMLSLPSIVESSPKSTKSMQNMINYEFTLPRDFLTLATDLFTLAVKEKSFASICSKALNMFSQYVQSKLVALLRRFLSEMSINIDLNRSFLSVFSESQIPEQVIKMILQYFKTEAMPQLEKYSRTGNINPDFEKMLKHVSYTIQILEKIILFATLSIENTIKLLIHFAFKWISGKIVEMHDNRQAQKANAGKKEVECKLCKGVYYE